MSDDSVSHGDKLESMTAYGESFSEEEKMEMDEAVAKGEGSIEAVHIEGMETKEGGHVTLDLPAHWITSGYLVDEGGALHFVLELDNQNGKKGPIWEMLRAKKRAEEMELMLAGRARYEGAHWARDDVKLKFISRSGVGTCTMCGKMSVKNMGGCVRGNDGEVKEEFRLYKQSVITKLKELSQGMRVSRDVLERANEMISNKQIPRDPGKKVPPGQDRMKKLQEELEKERGGRTHELNNPGGQPG